MSKMWTQLPTTTAAQLTDITCSVQGYVADSSVGTSVQETWQQVFTLFHTNLVLTYIGNPNGNVAGTLNQLLWDSADQIMYICTVAGTSSTALWVPVIGQLTNGQVRIGSTGLAPVAATLTAGSGISISNGAGSITISGTSVINTGSINQLAYYASSGTTITGLPTADNGVLVTSGIGTPSISSTLPAAVQANIVQVGTIATGVWHASLVGAAYGGTGINNPGTWTNGGNVSFSGAYTFTGTLTGNTGVTFPTSGTLATTGQLPAGAALTEVSDTNVTLTLGGTPSTALLQATSVTAGWTGQLSPARGGTGINNSTNTLTINAASTINQDVSTTASPLFVNIGVNNIYQSVTGTVPVSGTTVLTKTSTGTQTLLSGGTDTQTYQLPDATTLQIGWQFQFNNNATGNLVVKDTSGTTIATVTQGAYLRLFCTSTSFSAGQWDYHWLMPSSAVYGTAGLKVTGTLASGSSGTQFAVDTSGNITAGTWAGTTVSVSHGGTGDTSLTAYAVLCGGTTSTSAVQSVASVGTAGQFLRSNGAGSLPTFQNSPGMTNGALIGIQVFTGHGTYTYTPSMGANNAVVWCVGGGGGGGNGTNISTNSAGGSGGGAGGISFLYIAGVVTETVTVGAGGAATVNGGTSSFGSVFSATGGSAGTSSVGGSAGGAGGSGIGGSVNISGESGTLFLGQLVNITSSAIGVGGNGGSNAYGAGGIGGSLSLSITPNAGTGYGAGGGGGYGTYPSTQSGAAGSDGIVFVWEYT